MTRLSRVALKRIQQLRVEGDPALVRWHKQRINALMRRFGLSVYALLWVSFFKGVLLTLLVIWLLGRAA